MPRFTPDMTKETAGIPILPKGDYEVVIRDAKVFSRDNDKGPVYGIMYTYEIVAGDDFVGKVLPVSLYMHGNSGALNKQFLMAAYGYATNQENEFNEEYSEAENYAIDTEDKTMGDYWKGVIGNRVNLSASVVPQKNDPDQMQNRLKWTPFL